MTVPLTNEPNIGRYLARLKQPFSKYVKEILGGVKWVLNMEEGDATPNPELSAKEDEKAKAAVKK